MRRFFRSILFLTVAALPRVAAAQITPAAAHTPPDDTPSVSVGATIFMNYTFTASPDAIDADGNTISANAFDANRAYININGKINHAITFRITPDVVRASSVGNSAVFRIKYAYAQYSLDDWTGNWTGTWVRFGIHHTPLIDYEEGIYRYRFQGPVFAERVGKLTSSDAGVSFHSTLPDNRGEVHVGMYNGEGYSTVEANNEKAVQMRFTARPFATGALAPRGLRVTVFYDADNYAQADERARFVAESTFEHPHVNAGIHYLQAKDQTTRTAADIDGRGYSLWVTPIFKQKGNGPELLIRYDSWKPNKTAASVKQNTLIAGFAYWFPHEGSVAAALLLDYERTKYPGTETATQDKVGVHGLISF
jgi:hypothetical protein